MQKSKTANNVRIINPLNKISFHSPAAVEPSRLLWSQIAQRRLFKTNRQASNPLEASAGLINLGRSFVQLGPIYKRYESSGTEFVQPTFYIVHAQLPGLRYPHLAVFDNPEEAADHVIWLTPRAMGTVRTIECIPPEKVNRERPSWFPDWHGETTVMVVSGPSASSIPLDMARGRSKCIAINDSWRLAPWADVLYARGRAWWEVWSGEPPFNCLKISGQKKNPEWGLKLARIDKYRDEILVEPHGTIGWAGNSGFQALNPAIRFGAWRLVLVGYDMRIDIGVSWRGPHYCGLPNKGIVDVIRWRKMSDAQAPLLKELGVEVLNASPVSVLTAYPKVDFADAIGG